MHARWNLLAVVLLFAAIPGPGTAQDPGTSPVVVARVNDHAIYDTEVRRKLSRALGDRKVSATALPRLQAQTLEQLIKRRLVLEYLSRKEYRASESDIDLELQRIQRQLARQKLTLDQYLQRSKLSVADLRRTLDWQLSWQRYLDRHLNEETLQKFFQRHRREFDGTQVEVAHILWPVPQAENEESLQTTLRQASQVRQEIISGKLTFEQAARQHSAAPTAAQGGRMGPIERHQPMPEAFSQATFALAPGQISPPVVTVFGVHLIKCLEIKPGDKTWQDVRGQLEPALVRYLFDWISQRGRPTAQIEHTGAMPYLDAATGELKVKNP